MVLIVKSNPYNFYCQDCKESPSQFGNVTFGVFICPSCADVQRSILPFCTIKHLIKEPWADTEIDFFRPENRGGNQSFFDFLAKYKLENAAISIKYQGAPAKYFQKRLEAKVNKQKFDLIEPQNDFRD
mmetsp:Transcript_30700/g.22779  ORF Transcript_30700/g.22779 Transcript_30700/m.22779 type:complete len:128 (-) Transcript_30700:182-565(-)